MIDRQKFTPTRRQFLLFGGICAAAYGVHRVGTPLYEENRAWNEAYMPWQDFYKEHEERLNELSFGCSFSPEIFGVDEYPENNARYKNQIKNETYALTYLTDVLGMRDFRIGLRWRNIARNPKDPFGIDFEYYAPLLEHLMRRNVNLCINLGPIKTFGNPEEVPAIHFEYLMNEVTRNGGVVTKDMQIAKFGELHIQKVMTKLKKDYGMGNGKNLTIQLDNEPFNAIGIWPCVMDPDYCLSMAQLVWRNEYFPKANILINATPPPSTKEQFIGFTSAFEQTLAFAKRLYEVRPPDAGDIIIGNDFYFSYMLPDEYRFFNETLPLGKVIDTIALQKILRGHESMQVPSIFQEEMSELQAIDWNKFQIGPGKSVTDLQFALLRGMEITNGNVFRMWGAERFGRDALSTKQTDGQKEMEHLIVAINSN